MVHRSQIYRYYGYVLAINRRSCVNYSKTASVRL